MSIERNFYLAKILCYTVYPVCTCIYFEYGEPVFLYFLVFYIYVSIVVTIFIRIEAAPRIVAALE